MANAFIDLDIGISYITFGPDNVRDKLIIPALRVAKYYKRSVGFFSTSVFDTILDGVVDLVRNDGKIQIIASPKISAKDAEEIALGYKLREEIAKNAFLKNFDDALSNLSDEKLAMATQLIAEDVLDIKITDLKEVADVNTFSGDYHDKLGIIQDVEGNSIVFVGSPNETINGLVKNYEKVRVFKSWNSTQNEYVKDELKEFDDLWDNLNPFLNTFAFKSALKEHVLKIKKEREQKPKGKAPIVLRDYQKEAINAWKENNYHGFFVMATGTGKTWTAIFAVKKLIEEKGNCLTVICAPYKHLVKQWAEDVENAFPEAKIVLVSSENHVWTTEVSDAILHQKIDKSRRLIIITTITSFNLPRFKETISKSRQPKILVVDEAHRFTKRNEELKQEYKYMLGLSATPFSGKESARGLELMKFFGGQVYNLPIEEALKRGFLVPYNYYPIFVHATEEEENQFKKWSAKMMNCFKNGICIDPENLVKYARNRLRIISMAQAKIDLIDEILDHVEDKDHFIVYCGDGKLFDDNNEEKRHINHVKEHVLKKGLKVSQFTATENMKERMDLVRIFNAGDISALAAIRCLDEGINIPSIKSALILSSNDDYREFTQRRGRILRLYKDKKYANIYDVIVLPSLDNTSFATIELRRFNEYAHLALNAEENINELENLMNDYGLNYEDIVFNYEDAGEELIDE